MMTIETAIEVCKKMRATPFNLQTEALRAEFKIASEVRHNHSMENDASYRRGFRQAYNGLAVGTGRLDLVGKHG